MGLLVSGLVVLGTVLGIFTARYQQQTAETGIEGLLWPKPKLLAPFMAVDNLNNPFTLADLHGKWSFLFFGYTHCPDICPITLAIMDKVHRQLDQTATKPDVQTVFISVDPKRDTPARLDQYVTSFNREFIGVGGSVEQVASITGQVGVGYYLNKTAHSENYLVDHGASVFLI